ncbi:nitrogen regulation protein NR(II), partial [Terriglobus sp. YAF25]
ILEKLHAGEKVEHYETTRLSKNGDLRQVSITISPIRNDAGKVIGASKIARDISERKKMEFLLVQAEKLAATGRMAAAIAHEINNPLASVLNLIFLARQSSASRAEIQEYLGTAESELERVSHIARQTLGYYRDNASPCEVHLHDLVQNVLSVYRTRLQAHNIVLETTFNDLRKIKVRPGEMIQVLSNVISNAMDAMPLGGSMSITVAPTKKVDRNGVQITVRDTGSGIPREHLDKVFEPFFTTKGNLGTGIGLWVANQLVQRHHGQISISSSTERGDSGTTVTIYLPFGSFEGTTTKPNGAQRDS